MYIKYLGHSCFSFETNSKKTILIDPIYKYGDPVDLVLVTHGHSDHLGYTIDLKKPTIAIYELAHYLKHHNVPAIGMNIGGTYTFDDTIKIHMVPAIHSSSVTIDGIDHYMGSATGFVMDIDGIVVYHSGDTALFSDMKLIRDMYHPDIAILPIGDRFTMGLSDAKVATEFIGAKLVIPMHYNTFPEINQDVNKFKQSIESNSKIKVEILEPGDRISISVYKKSS